MSHFAKLLFLTAPLGLLPVFAADVSWDGDVDNDLGTATNWSMETTPNASDDFEINSNSSFTGANNDTLIFDSGNKNFGSLGITAAGSNGGLKVTSGSTGGFIKLYGDLSFSGPSLTGTVSFEEGASDFGIGLVDGNRSIINTSSATVTFGKDAEFAFHGWNNSNRSLYFGGTGDFILGTNIVLTDATTGTFRRVTQFATTPDFTGELLIEAGAGLITGNPGLRVDGGTIKVEGTDTITSGVQVGFGTGSSLDVTRELDFRGLIQTNNSLGALSSFASTGTNILRVNAVTSLEFNDLRISTGKRSIDIQGWVENQSSLAFNDLGGNFYHGTVAEGESIVDLTISGQPAYLTGIAPGIWGVTSIGPAIPLSIVSGTYTLSDSDQIADDIKIVMDQGTLDLNSHSDIVGELELQGDSLIDLNDGGSIAFADSSLQSWSGTLNVIGDLNAQSIRFGTDADGLALDQLRAIRIGADYARLDTDGYLQPLIASDSQVSGDNSGRDFYVVGGGELSGVGTIRNLVLGALAKVAPGSIGAPSTTLNLVGDLTGEVSAVMVADVSKSGSSISNDMLAVTGSVDFQGVFDLLLDGDPLVAGDEITLVTGAVQMLTFAELPADVVVHPASPTVLAPGLELKVVYYSDKISVLVQNEIPNPFGALRHGDFDQGMFFWEVVGPSNGVGANFSVDATDPQAGKNSLKIELSSPTTNVWDFQLHQSFHIQGGETYALSFKIKTDVAAPTTLKWLVEDTKILGRRLGTYYGADNNWLPDIDDFREDFTISSADGWKTISRTINPQDRDAAVLTIAMGNAAAGTYWIDDVKVVGLAPPKPTDFKVVGYYPPYRLGSLPIEAFEHIDVLNHSALMSAADGSILRYYKPSDASTQHNFDKTITDYEGNSVTVKDHLLAIKAAHGLELIVTVIGKKADTRSSTDGFIEMLLTQARRETFADNLVQFCLDNGFDGVDLNFEWPSSLNNSGVESEQERYRYFIEYLREALDDEGLKLSQAPGLFGPAYYDPDTYWRMDRNCHQGYNRDDELYLENILRAFRVAMPFHTVYPGIIWAAKPSSGSDITYRTLYAAHAPARHENYAGDYYFNGIDSVRQKVQIARRLGCAGVMIWELGQDTVGEDSSLIRRSLEDCDGDALLDKWEEEFSGGTNLRPLMDDDGDKLINLWENLTGTNPLDSSSMAGLSPAVTQDAGSDYFSVSLPYENPERLNLAIEATNDLADSESWQDLNTEVGGNAEATVTNDVLTVEQTNAIGSGSDFSFLRARVEAKE